jgi:hypothetical protein
LSLQDHALLPFYKIKKKSAELVEYEENYECLDAEVEEDEVVATKYEDIYEEEHYLIIASCHKKDGYLESTHEKNHVIKDHLLVIDGCSYAIVKE